MPVFLEVCGIHGDYPASSSVLDVFKHRGTASYKHFDFPRPKRSGEANVLIHRVNDLESLHI